MKILFKTIILTLFIATGFIAVQAQPGGGRDFDPVKRAERTTTMMVDSLSLSTKQGEKVGEINLKYAKLMQEARNQNTEGDWETMRATMMSMRTEQNKELQKVLTTDQWQKWEKIQEAMWSGRGERGSNNKERQNKQKEKKS